MIFLECVNAHTHTQHRPRDTWTTTHSDLFDNSTDIIGRGRTGKEEGETKKKINLTYFKNNNIKREKNKEK